jgi:hypothetical protein
MKAAIPQNLIISTLFGLEVAKQTCNTCDKEKYKHEFYILSSSNKRHKERVRGQCKECWGRFKGDSEWGRYILKCEVSI